MEKIDSSPCFWREKILGTVWRFFSQKPHCFFLLFCFDLKAWSLQLGCKSTRSCMDFSQTDGMWGTQLTACRSEEELLAQLASGAGQSGRVEREKLIQDNLTCLSMASTFSFYAASMPHRTFQSQTMSDCIGLILTSFLWTSFSSWEHESPKTRRRNLHGRQSWKVQSL